jgi:hypothetical protein
MSKNSITIESFNFTNFKKSSIDKYFNNINDNDDLLLYFLNNIRNFLPLNNQMLENIKNFDEDSKMKIIIEYNNLIKTLKDSNILSKNRSNN